MNLTRRLFQRTMANYLQAVSRTMEANFVNISIEMLFTAVMAFLLRSVKSDRVLAA